jgi:predicted phosphoadenosine phosphosulfate sulfurtransferase
MKKKFNIEINTHDEAEEIHDILLDFYKRRVQKYLDIYTKRQLSELLGAGFHHSNFNKIESRQVPTYRKVSKLIAEKLEKGKDKK